jgi:hypothetical protein
MTITKQQALALLQTLQLSKEFQIHFDALFGLNSVPSLKHIQNYDFEDLVKMLDEGKFQCHSERLEILYTVKNLQNLCQYLRNVADVLEVNVQRDSYCSHCEVKFTPKELSDKKIVEFSFHSSGRKFWFHQSCFVEIAGDKYL